MSQGFGLGGCMPPRGRVVLSCVREPLAWAGPRRLREDEYDEVAAAAARVPAGRSRRSSPPAGRYCLATTAIARLGGVCDSASLPGTPRLGMWLGTTGHPRPLLLRGPARPSQAARVPSSSQSAVNLCSLGKLPAELRTPADSRVGQALDRPAFLVAYPGLCGR